MYHMVPVWLQDIYKVGVVSGITEVLFEDPRKDGVPVGYKVRLGLLL